MAPVTRVITALQCTKFEPHSRWILLNRKRGSTEHSLSIIIRPSSWYDSNTVEKDIKLQIIHPSQRGEREWELWRWNKVKKEDLKVYIGILMHILLHLNQSTNSKL